MSTLFKTLQPLSKWIKASMTTAGDNRRLVLGCLLLWLVAASSVALLGLSGWFITAAAVYVSFDVFLPGGGIRLFALMRTLSRYAERLVNHDNVLRSQARWRLQLFKQLSQQPDAMVARLRPGTVLQSFMQDVETLDDLWLRWLNPSMVCVLMVLVFVVLQSIWLPVLAMASGTFLLLLWLLMAGPISNLQAIKQAQTQPRQQRLRSSALAYFRGADELHGWQQRDAWLGRMLGLQQRLIELERRNQQVAGRWQQLLNVALYLHTATIIIWVIAATQAEQVSPAVAVLLVLASLGLNEVFTQQVAGSSRLGRLIRAAAVLNRWSTPAPPDASSRLQAPADVLVRAEGVEVCLAPGQPLTLSTTDLMVKPGDRLLLVGASGAGKSTWLQLMAGAIVPTAGCLALTSRPPHVLPQHTNIIAGSIRTNLLLANAEADEARLWLALEAVELATQIRALPDQLDSWIGSGGQGLSGGQLRRLMLARLFVHQPAWVLLDEPYRHLQAVQAERIHQRLIAHLDGAAMVITAHQADQLASYASMRKILLT